MYSQNILARARRLTDTEHLSTKHELLREHAAGSLGGGTNSSVPTPAASELLSIMSCRGGLESTKTTNVGSLKVSWSVHTQPGADPGGNVKDNQDAWCVQERLGGQDMALFGVFDGHGQEGRVVAHTICGAVPTIMARTVASKAGPSLEDALAAAFPEANRSLRRVPGLDADLSGSTGIVAVLAAERVVVGNLGDSRCVLGKVDVRGGVTAVALSSDHTPMDQQEASRILASGGRIASFMCGDEPLGPPRVWLRELNVPGLCMTRSFGDYVAASVGVLDQPQVVTTALRPHEDRYLVLMSDGIFEFLDSQQVMAEVHAAARAGQSAHEAARRLVKLARQCWREQEDEIIDDCTCMVIYLSPAPATAAVPVPSTSASGSTAKAQAAASATAAALATKLDSGLRIAAGSSLHHAAAPGASSESGVGGSARASGAHNISRTSAASHPGALGYKHSGK